MDYFYDFFCCHFWSLTICIVIHFNYMKKECSTNWKSNVFGMTWGWAKKTKIGEFFLWSGLWLKHLTCYSTQTHKNVLKKSYPLQLRQLCRYLVDFKKTSHDAYIYLIISWIVFNKLSIGINRPCITIHSSPAFSYICQFITFRGVWL